MKPHIARPPTAKKPHESSESIAQQQPLPAPHQQSHQRPSGEDRRHSPWDTDAESIDTTIDQSIAQVENVQQHQHHQQQLQHNHEEAEAGSGEASDPDELEDEVVELSENVIEFLAEHDLADATRKEQMSFLKLSQPHLFPTIDGDSYPTTTDGHPTEWDEQPEPHYKDLGSPSISSERLSRHLNVASSNQQPLQTLASNLPDSNLAIPHGSKFWRQGAQIREQERNDNAVQVRTHFDRELDTTQPPASQPPLQSQITNERHLPAPSAMHAHVKDIFQTGQSIPPRRSNRAEPRHVHNPVAQASEPTVRHTSTMHAHVVPMVQQHVEFAPVSEAQALPEGDYDPEVLAGMAYDDLRDESFDKNPRQRDPFLPKDMREKPLSERLHFVQLEFDPAKQSEFFGALPTSEWEDAGDWFLDQFSAIIQKTKEARQKKRKAAQELEQEIEGRHQQISKKQRLVEGAMAKMQAQGEELVPKSPRSSKGPRPKRA